MEIKFLKTTASFLAALIILANCTQKRIAPISSKGKTIYDRNNSFNGSKYKAFSEKSKLDKAPESVVVNQGETLYSIARKSNIPIRDIIETNNLQPPYNLAAGTKINLPTAKYHQVAAGETLYSISRNYGMNVDRLIEMNHLEKPYTIKLGDMLHISESAKIAITNNKSDDNKAENKNVVIASGNLEDKKIEEKKPTSNFIFKNNHFIWPIKGQIISKFGSKAGGLYNDGINIKAKKGDSVKVVEDGNVAYVGNELRGYGNLIIIKHSGGWISAYAHLDKTKVKRGDKIEKGTEIATIGSTGNVDSPQLYFGIRKGREAVNPETYLASN
jgi:murein DD-endopeptidase MepM/ murein hydrolase activator NlpD